MNYVDWVQAAGDLPIKLILETPLLSEVEIDWITRLFAEAIVQAGHPAAFYQIKGSTGMLKDSLGQGLGTTVEHVQQMKRAIYSVHDLKVNFKIKASGGIRTREQAERLLAAGAHRLGTSSGVSLLSG